MKVQMKPETIARRSEEHRVAMAARLVDLRARMVASAEAQGPDSIYWEMIAELDARKAAA